jgi:hypothetical protein
MHVGYLLVAKMLQADVHLDRGQAIVNAAEPPHVGQHNTYLKPGKLEGVHVACWEA